MKGHDFLLIAIVGLMVSCFVYPFLNSTGEYTEIYVVKILLIEESFIRNVSNTKVIFNKNLDKTSISKDCITLYITDYRDYLPILHEAYYKNNNCKIVLKSKNLKIFKISELQSISMVNLQ